MGVAGTRACGIRTVLPIRLFGRGKSGVACAYALTPPRPRVRGLIGTDGIPCEALHYSQPVKGKAYLLNYPGGGELVWFDGVPLVEAGGKFKVQ